MQDRPSARSLASAIAALAIVMACGSAELPGAVEPPASRQPTAPDPLATSDLPDTLEAPLPDDPLGVTIHRLANGMTVYLSTVRDRPRVAAWVAVRAGSRHDPPHATGLAHYLEHMLLFKGTDEIGTVDAAAEAPHLRRTRELYRELGSARDQSERARILREIDAASQRIARTTIPNESVAIYSRLGFTGTDAQTYKDRTHYYTEAASNRLEQWAIVEAERFSDPVFRLFFPELEAVYEEKNRALDNPGRQSFETMMSALFPAHPYGTQDTLGTVEHLETPALDEMIAFFERWYVPNNMAIILVGDVDERVLPMLEKHFGRSPARAIPAPPHGRIEPVRGRVERTIVAPGEPVVRLAWPTVPASHADEPALELVELLLDDRRVGSLASTLVTNGTVPAAGAWREHFAEAGYFAVEASLHDEADRSRVETALRAAVRAIATEAVDAATLAAIKQRAAMQRALESERLDARAQRILDAYTRREPWSDVVARAARFQRLTADDVKRVAARWLGDDVVVVHRVTGNPDSTRVATPTVTPLRFAEATESRFVTELAQVPVAPGKPRFVSEGDAFQRRQWPGGELVAVANERNDLFALTFEVERDARSDDRLCHAVDAWARSGTRELDPDLLQRRLFELGASVSTRCDDRRVAIELAGLDRNFDASLAILRGWLAAPRLDSARLRELSRGELARRRASLDDDDAIAAALADFALLGSQSPHLRVASNGAIGRATPEQLMRLVSALPRLRHRLSYFGPRKLDDVVAAVELGTGTREPGRRPRRDVVEPRRHVVHLVDRPSAKADVRVSLASAATPPGHEALVEVIRRSLERRTFDDVRGARALAYRVRAGVDVGRLGDETITWGSAQAHPDKVGDVVEALVAVLTAPAVDESRLAIAREVVGERTRSRGVEPRLVASQVRDWADRGLDGDPSASVLERLGETTAESVAGWLARNAESNAVITIVGDTSRIDMAALRGLGDVQIHRPETLFGYGPFPGAR